MLWNIVSVLREGTVHGSTSDNRTRQRHGRANVLQLRLCCSDAVFPSQKVKKKILLHLGTGRRTPKQFAQRSRLAWYQSKNVSGASSALDRRVYARGCQAGEKSYTVLHQPCWALRQCHSPLCDESANHEHDAEAIIGKLQKLHSTIFFKWRSVI